MTDLSKQISIFKENAVDFIGEDELRQKLATKKQLTLKIGFDPTAADIHLGHTVLLRKLRKLQDSGHRVVLIIGDFTAKIGDPSGQTVLRPVLSDDQIKKNASTYKEQVFKILNKDDKKTIVRYNSEWFKKMELSAFLQLFSYYTLARILERDDFSQRFKENRPLTMLELTYPLIQGYDSVEIEADVEFGGTDQKFNLLVGRYLQQVYKQQPQAIVTMPLLVGLEGTQKMSKSLGNYIGVNETAKEMFGKIMSISDEVMWEYFRLLTDENVEAVKKLHPKEAKLMLAVSIVSQYHSPAAAKAQREEFERVFSQKKLPDEIPQYKITLEPSSSAFLAPNIIDILYKAKVVESKNEARRLLSQKAICSIDPVTLAQTPLTEELLSSIPSQGLLVKVGKRKFLKILVEKC